VKPVQRWWITRREKGKLDHKQLLSL